MLGRIGAAVPTFEVFTRARRDDNPASFGGPTSTVRLRHSCRIEAGFSIGRASSDRIVDINGTARISSDQRTDS